MNWLSVKSIQNCPVRICRRVAASKGQKLHRKTSRMNLKPQCFQSLNYQPKNIHRLDLGLSAHMQQMCYLIFKWVTNNWNGLLPIFFQPACLCLTLVGDEVPSLEQTGRFPPTHLEEKGRIEGMIVEGGDLEAGSE